MVRVATSRPHESSFFASGTSFLAREAARRATKSREVLRRIIQTMDFFECLIHGLWSFWGATQTEDKSGLYHTKAENWVFLGVAETIVGSHLCCRGSNVHCLFNLLYYIIWLLHQSTTPRNYQKIGLTVEVAWWSLFASVLVKQFQSWGSVYGLWWPTLSWRQNSLRKWVVMRMRIMELFVPLFSLAVKWSNLTHAETEII